MRLYTSYSEETQTQIEEFLENTFGWDEDELVDFVERFGETNFQWNPVSIQRLWQNRIFKQKK